MERREREKSSGNDRPGPGWRGGQEGRGPEPDGGDWRGGSRERQDDQGRPDRGDRGGPRGGDAWKPAAGQGGTYFNYLSYIFKKKHLSGITSQKL